MVVGSEDSSLLWSGLTLPPRQPKPNTPWQRLWGFFFPVVSEISASGVHRRKSRLALVLFGSHWEALLYGKPEFRILVTFQAYVWVTSQEMCHWLDIKNDST